MVDTRSKANDTPRSTDGLPGQGRSVLISGGSIAGPAVAWWLNKYGFSTTIVERWKELRPGGQNIDVRGVGVSHYALNTRLHSSGPNVRGESWQGMC